VDRDLAPLLALLASVTLLLSLSVARVADAAPKSKASPTARAAVADEAQPHGDDGIQTGGATGDDYPELKVSTERLRYIECWVHADFFGSMRRRLGLLDKHFGTVTTADSVKWLLSEQREELLDLNGMVAATRSDTQTIASRLEQLRTATGSHTCSGDVCEYPTGSQGWQLRELRSKLNTTNDQLAALRSDVQDVAAAIEAQGPNVVAGPSEPEPVSFAPAAQAQLDDNTQAVRRDMWFMFGGLAGALLAVMLTRVWWPGNRGQVA
jgi:hypothetical protein